MVERLSESSFSVDDVRRETRSLIGVQASRIDELEQNVLVIKQTAASASLNYSGITNILDNSHPEWSKAAYDATGVSPSDAGDTNLECKNFYRQPVADTDLVPTSATALKTAKSSEPADHTLWAANEGANADIPRWNKPNGYIEMGGLTTRYDLYYPIPNDVIFPGQQFIFQFEAQLDTTDALPSGIQAYAGFYDETAGQRKFIEGGDFAITDQNGNNPGVTFGIPGSTSVEYRILARTDSGEEVLSDVLTFPNAPATFDQNNHPRIKFSGVAGFIEFEIYRHIGTEYVRQFTVRNTIDGMYSDIGNPPEAHVSGWPSVTTTRPRAFAQTTNFSAGLLTQGFVRNALNIFVPTTYNRSVTAAGMQYLRIGFTLPTTVARQIRIRRLGLSMGDGVWARSANDLRTGVHSAPSSSTATGSPGGDGGGGIDPPPPTGGGSCLLLDVPVRTDKGQIALRELRRPLMIDNGGPVFRAFKGVKIGHAARIFHVRTEDGGHLPCTWNEPLITSKTDRYGTWAETLKRRLDAGESVYTLRQTGNEPFVSRIVSIDVEHGDFSVGEPTVEGGIFIAAGFVLHNKPILDGNF